MSQITIDMESIKHGLLIVFAVIGLIFVVGCGVVLLLSPNSAPSPATTTTVQTITTVAPPTYPSVLTFTVLSATTVNGRFQVLTTAGNILYFADYYTWNSMIPRATYTATLVGTDGVAYNVGSVVLLSYPSDYYDYRYDNYRIDTYDYPTYWHYGNNYYQCDNRLCDQVSYKHVEGEYVRQGRPPYPIRGY